MGGIGRFVRSGRESLCLVRARGEALVLETLFLAEDVYSQAEIEEAVEATEREEGRARAGAAADRRARRLVRPGALTSEYRRDLRELLEAKLRGEEIAMPEPVAEPAPAIDLMEALKASVAAAKSKSADARRRRRPPSRAGAPRSRPEQSIGRERPRPGMHPASHQTIAWRAVYPACAAPAPTAASCAWKRVLSILPW